jgi:pyruvate dehydrogenase E1 component alpha subunit
VPRKKIRFKQKIEYLSILDEKGVVDAALEPKLNGDQLLSIYRSMLFTRLFDQRMLALQRQGRIGTYAPVRGQEATQIGAVAALRPSDWMVQSFREPGSCFHRGWTVHKLILFWGGYEEGCAVPEGINDTPIAVPVASQLPHLTGIAWGMKIKGVDDVAVGFVGDGGTSEGDFHEALTFAGVFMVPAIFVIANNQWAISHPRDRQTASETLAQKAVAYGFDGIQVDGNDVLAVYAATTEAIAKARAGDGPTLIEAVTYRLGVHTTADDPKKYRDETEVEQWEKKDPVPRFSNYLLKKGVADRETLDSVEEDLKAIIKEGVEQYEAGLAADPLHCFDYMYVEMPDELGVQRKEFAAALEREGLKHGH